MTAVLDKLWLTDGFHEFAVEFALARRELHVMVLKDPNHVPSTADRRRAHDRYTVLSEEAAKLGLTALCSAMNALRQLLDPDGAQSGPGTDYGRRLFAIGVRIDTLARDIAMTLSQSSEWSAPPMTPDGHVPPDSMLLLDNGARGASELSLRLGRVVRVRVDQSSVSLPSHLLPLFHRIILQLARNAVLHGIETTQERRRAGKPTTAVINLSARTEGPLAVVQVKDDGRGIDVAAAGVPDPYTPAQLWKAIAAPGFSTAGPDIHAHGGRGIGLTRIQNTLERLGGFGEARTWAGHGAHIRVCLPTES